MANNRTSTSGVKMDVKEIRRRLLGYKAVDTTLPEVQKVCREMNCDAESLRRLTERVQQSVDRVGRLNLDPLRTDQILNSSPVILEGSNANTGIRKLDWLLTFDGRVIIEKKGPVFAWTLYTEENPFGQLLTLLEIEDRLNHVASKIARIERLAKARTFLKGIGTLPRVLVSRASRERARFRHR